MKEIIKPKCPYCHTEYKEKSAFNNKLSGLYGEYCSSTVSITCEKCETDDYLCPTCGSNVSRNSTHCNKCGQRLESEE